MLYLKLAFKNLRNQKSRTLLTIIGMTIGIASLVLFLALSNGLKQIIFQNIVEHTPLTQITVQTISQKKGFLSLLPETEGKKLNPQAIEEISNIPFVESVYPEISYQRFSSIQVNIFGKAFQSDAMIFGLPYDYLDEDLKKNITREEWDNPSEPYPALISRRIIDLYNFTVAPTNNLPSFSEETLQGKEFLLLPGYSSFLSPGQLPSKSIRVKIAGFSDKATLVGVTIPFKTVQKLNALDEPASEVYTKLFVNVDRAEHVANVMAELEKRGFAARSTFEDLAQVENNMRLVTLGLSLISFIILGVAGLMIANTFLSSIQERLREIGILKALGASKKQIRKIFLAEAGMLGSISGFLGILLAVIAGIILDRIILQTLPEFSVKPSSFFVHDSIMLLAVLFFSIIFALFFAFIPAFKASRVNLVQALHEL